MNYDAPKPATDHAIAKARAGLDPNQLAAIKRAMASKTTNQPAGTNQAAVRREVDQAERGRPPAFPTAAVTAAVRAADVLLPADLEARTLQITEMYLNKIDPEIIARTIGVDITVVKKEIVKIDQARAVAFKDNEDLAEKVVEQHFDVLAKSIEFISEGVELLAHVKKELMWDHNEAEKDFEKFLKGEFDEDPNNPTPPGQKPKKRKNGMYSMKLDSYFRGMEATGKQMDRVATILGLMGKHVQPSAGSVTNITQNVQFNSDKLNAIADQFLLASGNSIAEVARIGADRMRPQDNIIDADAVEIES